MGTIVYILIHIVLPIFILISVGFIAQRALIMDVRTFTKLNIYIFVPAILFIKVYETEVTWKLFGTIAVYLIAICLVMFVLGEGVARLFHYPRSRRKAFVNSIVLFNGGNYGLPLIQLAFHSNPLAITVQIFTMLIQNVMTNTIGVFQASSGSMDSGKALKNVLMMPSIYVLLIVIMLKTFSIQLPEFFMVPIKNISSGFIAMALITLGVQLAEVKVAFRIKEVLLSSFIRLIIAPVVGVVLVYLMGLEGIVAKALILGVATPAAVSTAIFAKEFNNEPEYASQIVFVSTILSSVTISIIIFLLEYL